VQGKDGTDAVNVYFSNARAAASVSHASRINLILPPSAISSPA
jgi:hypothetical protein